MSGAVTISSLPPDFADWDELLSCIRRGFAFMDGVIDPPSSVHLLTPEKLAAKGLGETVFAARLEGRIVGAVFAEQRSDRLYLSKLAVEPALQGREIGRRLVAAAERLAREQGLKWLELQTRMELRANQQAFKRLGFEEVGRSAHPGYSRPTTITMRRRLA